MPDDDEQLIGRDAAVCQGEPTVRGTRIPVGVVLDNLAAGLTTDEILDGYPSLTVQDIQAAVAYGDRQARSDTGIEAGED